MGLVGGKVITVRQLEQVIGGRVRVIVEGRAVEREREEKREDEFVERREVVRDSGRLERPVW